MSHYLITGDLLGQRVTRIVEAITKQSAIDTFRRMHGCGLVLLAVVEMD